MSTLHSTKSYVVGLIVVGPIVDHSVRRYLEVCGCQRFGGLTMLQDYDFLYVLSPILVILEVQHALKNRVLYIAWLKSYLLFMTFLFVSIKLADFNHNTLRKFTVGVGFERHWGRCLESQIFCVKS